MNGWPSARPPITVPNYTGELWWFVRDVNGIERTITAGTLIFDQPRERTFPVRAHRAADDLTAALVRSKMNHVAAGPEPTVTGLQLAVGRVEARTTRRHVRPRRRARAGEAHVEDEMAPPNCIVHVPGRVRLSFGCWRGVCGVWQRLLRPTRRRSPL